MQILGGFFFQCERKRANVTSRHVNEYLVLEYSTFARSRRLSTKSFLVDNKFNNIRNILSYSQTQ